MQTFHFDDQEPDEEEVRLSAMLLAVDRCRRRDGHPTSRLLKTLKLECDAQNRPGLTPDRLFMETMTDYVSAVYQKHRETLRTML